MSVILKDLRPGDLFRFSPQGLVWVYEGRGWAHSTTPGSPNSSLLVETEQVVFRVDR